MSVSGRDLPDLIRKGVQAHEAGQLPEADAIYRQVLDVEPDHADANHLLGVIAHQAGRTEMAVQLISKAIRTNPAIADYHNNLGTALQKLGKPDEAVASHLKALAIKPDFAEAHNDLGNALQELGNQDDAATSYLRALAIKPDFAIAHNNLGNALQKLGKLDAAVASYRQALAIEPGLADGWFNLHVALFDTADLEPSAECLEKTLKIDPAFPRARFDLGLIRDYQGNAEAAARHFDGARKEADWVAYRLDSWQYVKSVAGPRPPLFGSTSVGLSLGIEAAGIDGLVLEFGVRFGSSIRQISALANQDVHGFDTFQGLPEDWHDRPKGLYTTQGRLPTVPGNVRLHVGLFEDTLPSFLKENSGPVRFANVDCDLYGSTKTVLDLLAERIVPGTVLIFDEYLGNPRWREDEFKAFQEAVENFGWRYEYLGFSLLSNQAVVLMC